MKKNYALFSLLFVFGFFCNSATGQIVTLADYASIPNGSTTTVAIPNVLSNDTFNGLPATLSDVSFTSVSSSSNFLYIDTATGSVIFSGGPAPIGTYSLEYYLNDGFVPGYAYVSIGCNELTAPIISNLVEPNCSSTSGSITLTGLPSGQWLLFNQGQIFQSGTGSSATFNLGPGTYEFTVRNSQGCNSPPTAPLDFRYLSAYLFGDYTDTNADGIPSAGDVIVYRATVTNESSCAMTNVGTNGGNILLGGPIPSLAAGATNSTTLTLNYTITQANINAGFVAKYTTIRGTAGSIPLASTSVAVSSIKYFNQNDGIKMVAFVDVNGNGIQDANEPDFRSGEFTYEINNDGTVHYIAANQANYLYETSNTNSYDLGFIVASNYAAYYSTPTTISNVTVANGSGITTYYFPLTIVPYTELTVNIYGYLAPPRPGFTYINKVQIQNAGNQLIPGGTLTFTRNDVVTITAVSIPGTVATANGFTYTFSAMAPGEIKTIDVTMLTPTIPTVSLGQLLSNTATVTIPSGDVYPENNEFTLTQAIVGSYDPNDKAETHGGKILYSGFSADDYLTFTIRFENTGTFNAEFVRVNDVLDNKLDETTVRMVDASHSYVLDRVGNNLSWFFNDIQLPPSVEDTNIGHGYLVFQVKPKAGFALGDIIPNTADIFFDFNPAIVTNTYTTEFVSTLATTGFAFDAFKSYPNPVKTVFNISNADTIDTITINSVLGQTMMTKSIDALETSLDVSRLSKGIYFVNVKSKNEVKTIKIIKE